MSLPLRAVRLATLALVAASPLASAQTPRWEPYGESGTGTFYYDAASVQSRDGRKRVWRLFELKEPRDDGVRSGKALIEFDCRESTYRYLRTMYYAGSRGEGKYLGGAQAQAAEPVGPGSMVALLAARVCGAG